MVAMYAVNLEKCMKFYAMKTARKQDDSRAPTDFC